MPLDAVSQVPIAVPIEQVLVGCDQKGTRATGRIENLRKGGIAGSHLVKKRPDRLPNDVLDHIGRSVEDAACLLELWLVLNHGPMACRQPYHLPEELFIHFFYYCGSHHRE